MLPRGFRLGACCLIILIYTFKECLRVRCAYTTPTFPDFNMNVYGVKHMNVYGVKHERLWG